MALNIIQGYTPSTVEPIDSRFVRADQAARYAINAFDAYDGLVVYQSDTKQLYVLVDKTNIGNSTGWQTIQNSASASAAFPFTGSAQITGSLGLTGSFDINKNISFISSSNLPSDVGATAVYAGGYATPNIGRLFIGDNTGWQFHFSRMSGSTSADIVTIRDKGQVLISNSSASGAFRVVGDNDNPAIFSGASLFAGTTPKYSLESNLGSSAYNHLLVMRGSYISGSAATRRNGIVFKMSSESDDQESTKMGAVYLESTQGWSNNPSLCFATYNTERMRIDTNGNVGIGAAPTSSARLDIRAATAASTDSAINVRDSDNLVDLFSIANTGPLTLRHKTFSGSLNISWQNNHTIQFSNSSIGVFMTVGSATPVNVVNFGVQQIVSSQRGAQFGSTLSATTPYGVNINGLPAQSSGIISADALRIDPTINNTGTYSGTYRGIYYNPTLTSLTGTTHRAIETVTGDVIFGSTSGNVGIGKSTPTARLDVSGSVLISGSLNVTSSLTVNDILTTQGARTRKYRTVTLTDSDWSTGPTKGVQSDDDIIIITDNTTTFPASGEANFDLSNLLSSPAGRCVEIIKIVDGGGGGIRVASNNGGSISLTLNEVLSANGRVVCANVGQSVTIMSIGSSDAGYAWGNGW